MILTLQLFRRRYPPWQPSPRHGLSLLPTGQEKTAPSDERSAFKFALFLQILPLLGLNVADVDLLVSFHSAWLVANASPSKDAASWISRAGRVGPPLTVVTWGVLLVLIRAHTCLVRLSRILAPPLPTHRERQQEGKKEENGARARPYFERHLLLDIVGLAIPVVSLASLLAKPWMCSAMQASGSRTQPTFPVNFIPALYWDGMGEATHARYTAFAGAVGALCLYGPALALLISLVARYKRRVLGMAVRGGFVVAVLCAALVTATVMVVTITEGLACALTDCWGCGMALLSEPVSEVVSEGVDAGCCPVVFSKGEALWIDG